MLQFQQSHCWERGRPRPHRERSSRCFSRGALIAYENVRTPSLRIYYFEAWDKRWRSCSVQSQSVFLS
jgi:hypothetical protein